MDVSEFQVLEEEDIVDLLESDTFPAENEEALEYSFPLGDWRNLIELRPRSVEPVLDYVESDGYSVTNGSKILWNTFDRYEPQNIETDARSRVNSFLKIAAENSDAPVGNYNNTHFMLESEGDFEALMDYSRLAFMERCLQLLDNGDDRVSYIRASKLDDYQDELNEELWESLVSEEYFEGNDSFDPYSFGLGYEARRSFTAYQSKLNNIRESEDDFEIKGSPEEISISREAVSLFG